jgi:ribosome maturation factor RimP
MIKVELIRSLAQERIDELDKGIYIVDITSSPGGRILVEVDTEEGSIAVVDCMSVSRNIEHNLDREVEDFSLEVTSPGLDMPFKVPQQYFKNIGRGVKIKTKTGKLEGDLIAADSKGITVKTTRKERLEGRKKKVTIEEEHKLSFEDIIETKIIITFK